MFEQVIQFVGAHPILVGMFVMLLVAFVINENKQGGASISTSDLVNLVNREDGIILDVRDGKEFGAGHIAGAQNIPFSSIDKRITELSSKKDKPVVVVCKMGQHAGAAGKKLKAAGFENVRRLAGGMAEWTASNLPVVKG